jgi:hypothetical protein
MDETIKDTIDLIFETLNADDEIKPIAIDVIHRYCNDYMGKDEKARVQMGFLILYAMECLSEKLDCSSKSTTKKEQ